MKLNCIIVDDEPVARKILEEYIADISYLHLIGKAENPLKAAVLLEAGTVDLMFLDINMPHMSGIELLKTMTSPPLTIITTAYPDYALEGFELDVLDYLVKPFSAERFTVAVTRAKEYAALKKGSELTAADNYFFVKSNGKIEKILYDELVYVEAMLNYVMLHTVNGKLMVYLTMKSLEEQLPSSLFMKVHKSTIINKTKIKAIQGNELDLGRATVTISQGLYDKVINEIVKNKLISK